MRSIVRRISGSAMLSVLVAVASAHATKVVVTPQGLNSAGFLAGSP